MRTALLALIGLLLVAVIGAAPPPPPRPRGPVIAVDTRKGTLDLNGVRITAFDLGAIRRALGAPGRTEKRQAHVRHERFGYRGSPPHATVYTVTDHHHVYDHLGLVFSTAHSRPWERDDRPVLLDVVYRRIAPSWVGQHPVVWPRRGFPGTLIVNGVTLDPDRLVLPAGVDHRTASIPLLGATFGPTSRGAVIDGLYNLNGNGSLRIFLDDVDHRRVAHLRIR